MTANTTVVNTNEFFCVPVGKSRQAAIFLGNLVKNAIEEGKRIPKRMEMGSDLGMCVKWIEDIGVPAMLHSSWSQPTLPCTVSPASVAREGQRVGQQVRHGDRLSLEG